VPDRYYEVIFEHFDFLRTKIDQEDPESRPENCQGVFQYQIFGPVFCLVIFPVDFISRADILLCKIEGSILIMVF
jgi:hypothetical protein